MPGRASDARGFVSTRPVAHAGRSNEAPPGRRGGGHARAILSTLQVLGRELAHYREDWQGRPSLIRQRWRGCRGGRGGTTDVDVVHKVLGICPSKTNPGLVIHRTTPHNSQFIGVVRRRRDAACSGASRRYSGALCRNRFRVSLYDSLKQRRNRWRREQFPSLLNEAARSRWQCKRAVIFQLPHPFSAVNRVATGVELIWTVAGTRVVLKQRARRPHVCYRR